MELLTFVFCNLRNVHKIPRLLTSPGACQSVRDVHKRVLVEKKFAILMSSADPFSESVTNSGV